MGSEDKGLEEKGLEEKGSEEQKKVHHSTETNPLQLLWFQVARRIPKKKKEEPAKKVV